MTVTSRALRNPTWMILATLALFCHAAPVGATPPVIFSQAAYQSPVRGDPGDLLILAGDGFSATDTVVYQAIGNTTQTPAAPSAIPIQSDANAGVAPVISSLDVPHSLTVLLPAALETDQSYVLWVQHADGEWSNGVLINDARPLWITPDSAYVTANTANLPRYLKVVGRNLQPAPGSTTQVMLVGPATYTLTASNDNYPTNSIDRYAANVTLPTGMPTGSYSVQVSRDGVSWVGVANGQTLTVNPDPVAPATFPVSTYGGCVPNDGIDDTPCIVQAIAAARAAGGGSVIFGPGVWDMSNSNQSGVVYFGVLVPQHVNLVGAGASSTTIRRDNTWYMGTPIFTLQGYNTVQDITFQDGYVYQPTDAGRTLIGLGVAPVNATSYNPSDPSIVSHVVITQNVFDQPFVGVQDGGMPIDHLFVTNNDFGAYNTGFFLDQTHYFSDSVIAYNTFEPGSYINAAIDQGAIPTGISSGQRVDFSNNVADGTSTRYLYNPATDPKGFRATFFWSLIGNHEQVLVSQNTSTCPGDKAGDGEAFAFDSNGDTSALPVAESVLAATSTSVTVQGPLLTTGPTAYTELWVQVAQGTGVGQVRPVVAYSDPTAQTVVLTVSPEWDVVPGANSLVTTSKEYWQLYTVDNFVDQRQPECTKGNANKPSGGAITLWGGSSDSAVEGNQQFDTNGIEYSLAYTVQSAEYDTGPLTGFQNFLDIRHNTVEGEYDWGASCSYSGIRGWYGASPDAPAAPPIESYGVSISHNTISQADDINGGAIALSRTWFSGPPPSTWQYAENTLIFHNSINNIANPPSGPSSSYAGCSATFPRQGIHFDDPLAWHTVLYANSCNNVAQNVNDQGTATLRACPAGGVPTNSCECAAYVQGSETNLDVPNETGSVTFAAAQNNGDLNLVIVNWVGSSQITSVTDSSGNTYSLSGGSTDQIPASYPQAPNVAQAIYYAPNIIGASSNTVTVTFGTSPTRIAVRLAEYSGVDPANPIDVTTSSYGVGAVADSGWITTTNPNDLLLGVELTGSTAAPQPGPGYIARLSTVSEGLGTDFMADEFVTTTEAYHAAAFNSPSSWWVMQFVALRLAGGGDTNTQALTTPTGLSAVAASSSQINLNWTGSTDNIGVTGYLIERCAGVSCANFAQVGSVGAGVTSYSDGGLQAATTYSYRVRATDVATLMSGYSGVAGAGTPAAAGGGN